MYDELLSVAALYVACTTALYSFCLLCLVSVTVAVKTGGFQFHLRLLLSALGK